MWQIPLSILIGCVCASEGRGGAVSTGSLGGAGFDPLILYGMALHLVLWYLGRLRWASGPGSSLGLVPQAALPHEPTSRVRSNAYVAT